METHSLNSSAVLSLYVACVSMCFSFFPDPTLSKDLIQQIIEGFHSVNDHSSGLAELKPNAFSVLEL